MEIRTFDVAPLEGYEPPYGLLLSMMQDGTREFLDELGQVSVDAIVWQPHTGSHSIGGELLHIIDVEAFWVEKAALGRDRDPAELKELMSAETDVDGWNWPTPPREPLEWYLERHARVRARTLESVKSFGPPEKTITFRTGEFHVSLRWILQHVFHHEAYHGGQAVLLKRLFELQAI